MADTYTPNYNLTKPEVGASRDTWGSKLNTDLDKIDTQMKVNANAAAAAQTSVTNLSTSVNASIAALDAAALKKSGGTMTGALVLSGAPTVNLNAATKAYVDEVAAAAVFPAGTLLLFAQTVAPTGWTKSTTHNNKALRVVSGTAGSGGSVPFTGAFSSQAVSGTIGDTALTVSQIPAHRHYAFQNANDVVDIQITGEARAIVGYTSGNPASGYIMRGNNTTVEPSVGPGSATGSGAAHAHTFTGTAIDLAVSYVDVIIASKN